MEMVYKLGLTTLPPSQQASHDMFTMSDALALYHRLKGNCKTKLFFEASRCATCSVTKPYSREQTQPLQGLSIQ